MLTVERPTLFLLMAAANYRHVEGLALAAGLTRPNVNMYLLGRLAPAPRTRTLDRLARALGRTREEVRDAIAEQRRRFVEAEGARIGRLDSARRLRDELRRA